MDFIRIRLNIETNSIRLSLKPGSQELRLEPKLLNRGPRREKRERFRKNGLVFIFSIFLLRILVMESKKG